MSILYQLREVACRTSRDVFERDFTGMYLLVTLPDDDDDDDYDFHTAAVQVPGSPSEAALLQELDDRLAGNQLFRVGKSSRNPWKSRITMGRAKNNDLILRHPSVSKLHAFFEGPATAPTTVVDVGSANGTVINGRQAPVDEPVPVEPGAVLRVGDVDCELLDAGQLHETIRALFPTANLVRMR